MALSDFSGTVPSEMSTQIIEEATQLSAALTLGNIMPMGTRISELPVPTAFPEARWVTAPPGPPANATGRKFYTDLKIAPQVVTAEEIAAVVAIPDIYLEDNQINLWNFVRPRMAEAIAIALDRAVFFGGGPATFPVGGIAHNNFSGPVIDTGLDPVDAVNQGMSRVERQGLAVTGHAADLAVKGALRGVRDGNGALLLGEERAVGDRLLPTLYGVPVAYHPLAGTTTGNPTGIDFFTGAWQYLIMGVRQDIRFLIDPSGVIVNDDGTQVLVSGFQDNVTPMKVWARFGCAIIRPATPRTPTGATPFAKGKLADWPAAPPLEDEDEGGQGDGDEGTDEPGRGRPGRPQTAKK